MSPLQPTIIIYRSSEDVKARPSASAFRGFRYACEYYRKVDPRAETPASWDMRRVHEHGRSACLRSTRRTPVAQPHLCPSRDMRRFGIDLFVISR